MIYSAEYNNLPTLDELVDNLNNALAQQPVLHLNPLERLVQRRDCFVVTRLMSGRYSLKPNIGFSKALFRGESLEGYKFCCIATFIVPKGAEYFENKYGHIVSSEIIYTGKYLRISNFNK